MFPTHLRSTWCEFETTQVDSRRPQLYSPAVGACVRVLKVRYECTCSLYAVYGASYVLSYVLMSVDDSTLATTRCYVLHRCYWCYSSRLMMIMLSIVVPWYVYTTDALYITTAVLLDPLPVPGTLVYHKATAFEGRICRKKVAVTPSTTPNQHISTSVL